jgi:penicillin-binding protein 1C
VNRRRRLATAACLAGLVFLAEARAALPDYAHTRADWHSSEAHLLDRHGVALEEFRVDPTIRRTDWTPLAEVSPALIAALLHAEDQRFYEHAGVDWLAAGRAALSNWLKARPRGASTLSMQLVALLDPSYRARAGRRDLAEKWRQMQAAGALEAAWSKSEILEAYLNLAPFRGELTGVDAAARGLFDKRPAGLSGRESLILAALIRAPNAAPKTVATRVCALAQGLPGLGDCAALTRYTLNTLSGCYPIVPAVDLAPHLAVRLVQQGELKHSRDLRTTLDAGLQRRVRTLLDEQLAHLGEREVHDAAAVVLDNASGDVLAYVSRSDRASVSPESDGVWAPRQAGSTLKPFLYGLALERRLLTAASSLDDKPLSIATTGGEYAPENYDHIHRGLVSARVALAGSLNIPAVLTLRLVGLEPFAARLATFGFGGLRQDADYYGYSLALGSLDVQLEELTNAYRTIANSGLYTPTRYTPDAPEPRPTRVQSRQTAWLIADILSDRQARAGTFGLENPLATRYWSAVKTGTSKDMRDNWCIGFSARYTVGVWVGNFSGAPMHDVSGISGAAPAWAAIMNGLHAETDSEPPARPTGLVARRVEPAGEPARREWFLPGTQPVEATWRAALPPARIVQPDDGALLALDPDLPPDRQRYTFQASDLPAGAWWRLDDVRLDRPDWPLARGHHVLTLLDGDGKALDQAGFEVR